jgi:hypothetical protein
MCRFARKTGVRSMFAALGAHASALQRTFLNRLVDVWACVGFFCFPKFSVAQKSPTQLRVAIFNLVRESIRSQV